MSMPHLDMEFSKQHGCTNEHQPNQQCSKLVHSSKHVQIPSHIYRETRANYASLESTGGIIRT